MTRIDPFSARSSLGAGLPDLYRLDAVADRIDLETAPVTVKILLENLLRHAGHGVVTEADVTTLPPGDPASRPRPRSRSCPRASSCRTSPASRPSWTWP